MDERARRLERNGQLEPGMVFELTNEYGEVWQRRITEVTDEQINFNSTFSSNCFYKNHCAVGHFLDGVKSWELIR